MINMYVARANHKNEHGRYDKYLFVMIVHPKDQR